MADDLMSVRIVGSGTGCSLYMNWFVLSLPNAEATFASLFEELGKASREEADRPPQFLEAVPDKDEAGLEDRQSRLSVRCFLGKERGRELVEVSGGLRCKECCSRFGSFIEFLVSSSCPQTARDLRPGVRNAFKMMLASAQSTASAGELPAKKGRAGNVR